MTTDLAVDLAEAINELRASTSPTAPEVADRLESHLDQLETMLKSRRKTGSR